MKLFRVVYGASLADQIQLDLSGILHFFFDLLCHFTGDQLHARIVYDLGLNHHADLASRLNSKCLIHTLEANGLYPNQTYLLNNLIQTL